MDFILVLINWSGRPLPWHLCLHAVHTHIYELYSWPSQIYMSGQFWISWFLGCERKERAMMNKCRNWEVSVQGTAAGSALQTEDPFSHFLVCWATLTCHSSWCKPLGSCQSGARQQRLQILVGRSWDEAGTRIIPWTLDPAGLGAQCGARAQQLQTSRGAGGSCWGKFQKRFSVQMLSVLIHPSLPGLWELCGCILGCLAIV